MQTQELCAAAAAAAAAAAVAEHAAVEKLASCLLNFLCQLCRGAHRAAGCLGGV